MTVHPSRLRLDSPSYSLYIARLQTGDTGTWYTITLLLLLLLLLLPFLLPRYCRVDGRKLPVSAYNIKVIGTGRAANKKLALSIQH